MSKSGIAAISTVVLVLLLAYFGFDWDAFFTEQEEPVSFSEDEEFFAESFSAEPANAGTADAESLYQIYFTDPSCPDESERFGSIDQTIADDIARAQFSIDIAAFDLDLVPIIENLIAAEEAGIFVRVVIDDEHTPESTTNRLRRNGISVIEDKRGSLMHNKFIVIDDRFVWTGSMNFAETGVYCNDNSIVRFDSPDLAANYSLELSEMYDERKFGPTSPRNTEPKVELSFIDVENHFAPEVEVAPILAREIARADEEVLFLAFSFTHEDIGEAIIERGDSGLQVRGVFEKVGSDAASSYYNDFRRARSDNMQVRRDGNPRIMHHKVIILDRSTTIFGSFNFSNNANDSNDENILIVRDPVFTEYFIEEFERVWD